MCKIILFVNVPNTAGTGRSLATFLFSRNKRIFCIIFGPAQGLTESAGKQKFAIKKKSQIAATDLFSNSHLVSEIFY